MRARRIITVGAGATILAASILLAPRFATADPQTDYMLHCRGCHGPDGSGAVGAVPSFREHVAKFARVAGGREYLIRVPGTAQSELDDARIAALLNWILAEFSAAEVPPNFAPFTAEEVAHHRRQPLTNPDLVRLELTRAIESLDNEQKVP